MKKIYSGNKKLFIAREITKVYENIFILTIDDWIKYFDFNDGERQKGEFIFLIPKNKKSEKIIINEEIESFIKVLLESDISYRSALKATCKYFGVKKNDIYKEYINLAKK